MRHLFCLCIVLVLYTSLCGQVVNIESQRMQSDTTGWLGNFGTSFLFQKNAVEVMNVNLNAHVQYKTKKDLYLVLGNYSLLKASGQTFSDNLFYHMRYNHKFNAWLRWEVFTQMQQNSVTGIDVRLLAGTGPRFKLHGTKEFALYTATAAMFEYEKEQTVPPVYHRDIRSSSYISFTYKPSASAEFINTIFYQPLFRDVSDYRVLDELALKCKLAKKLSFTAGFYYLYDSAPADETPKLNYSITNGIEYDF